MTPPRENGTLVEGPNVLRHGGQVIGSLLEGYDGESSLWCDSQDASTTPENLPWSAVSLTYLPAERNRWRMRHPIDPAEQRQLPSCRCLGHVDQLRRRDRRMDWLDRSRSDSQWDERSKRGHDLKPLNIAFAGRIVAAASQCVVNRLSDSERTRSRARTRDCAVRLCHLLRRSRPSGQRGSLAFSIRSIRFFCIQGIDCRSASPRADLIDDEHSSLRQ